MPKSDITRDDLLLAQTTAALKMRFAPETISQADALTDSMLSCIMVPWRGPPGNDKDAALLCMTLLMQKLARAMNE